METKIFPVVDSFFSPFFLITRKGYWVGCLSFRWKMGFWSVLVLVLVTKEWFSSKEVDLKFIISSLRSAKSKIVDISLNQWIKLKWCLVSACWSVSLASQVGDVWLRYQAVLGNLWLDCGGLSFLWILLDPLCIFGLINWSSPKDNKISNGNGWR